MELISPLNWKNYQLIDSGNFEKLERFGNYTLIRPEPQALWNKNLTEKEWLQNTDAKFIQMASSSGRWEKLKPISDDWEIEYQELNLKFKLVLTKFKHIGIFPEQAANWDFIYNAILKMNQPKPKVLNLFAYTGGASLAAKKAGADVVHLDSVKQIVSWAKQNMKLSNLNDVRWIIEDAKKFVHRELKRGNSYQGIILDPPAYGLGPKGERWKLEEQINDLLTAVVGILDKNRHFLVLNTYSLGLSSLIIDNFFKNFFPNEKFETGELFLKSQSDQKLPLGVFGRKLRL